MEADSAAKGLLYAAPVLTPSLFRQTMPCSWECKITEADLQKQTVCLQCSGSSSCKILFTLSSWAGLSPDCLLQPWWAGMKNGGHIWGH